MNVHARLKWMRRRSARGAAAPASEDAVIEAATHPAAHTQLGSDGYSPPRNDFAEALQVTQVLLQLDDEFSLPVLLNGQNTGNILEMSERVQQIRERERGAPRPVLNFGDPAWSGGSDW